MSSRTERKVAHKRDYKMKVCYTYDMFPESFELQMPKVKDQSIVNSCVAHSLSTFMEQTHKDEKLDFSVGFIYGYRPISYSQDEGMYPREALKTLQKIGDVENNYFNYNKEMPEIKQLVDNNMQTLLPLAELYKIYSYSRIYTIDEIKKCIYSGTPVPISIPVYNNLQYNKSTFIINTPDGKLNGYHMVIIYGWNKEGFLIQNSWGKDWANNGRAILPYTYEIDSAWAISTEDNSIYTYQTIWQKLYSLIRNIINTIKKGAK